MQADFDLDTVLSVVSRFNITDNYNNVIDLISFISGIPNISMTDFFTHYEPARSHILSLYPDLDDPIYGFDSHYISTYVNNQRERFGSTITISVFGQPVQKRQVN